MIETLVPSVPSELPPLLVVVPVKRRSKMSVIMEVVLYTLALIISAFILLAPPIYIFIAPFLFTEKNYKFEFCCTRKALPDTSTEEILFIISFILFYAYEFTHGCLILPATASYDSDFKRVSFLCLIKISCVTVMNIISLMWLIIKADIISVYYICSTIVNLIFVCIYYLYYKK